MLFDKCLRKAEAQEGGGAPRPAWVKTNGGSEGQRLEGSVVRGIWSRSRLDRDVLRGIWSVWDRAGPRKPRADLLEPTGPRVFQRGRALWIARVL